jgi:hypothetical protein
MGGIANVNRDGLNKKQKKKSSLIMDINKIIARAAETKKTNN